ncbi:type 2 isopentenyl-diphosphate Delta-isomerase [Candidatus Microgenomates bacterium]|nr:type 2 isopentenyl-diphosphate Delta-isomerase [Candidatus Microgenomates bacterium]
MKNLAKKKDKQLEVCLEEDVGMDVFNGFEKYQFVHQALPEIDFAEIDTSINFLGKKLFAPILISSMTGGTASAGMINQNLAKAAQKTGVAMGVGSQRVALQPQDFKHKEQNDYKQDDDLKDLKSPNFQKQSFNLDKRSRANFKELRLRSKEIINSFQLRNVAPDILLFANFGAIQLNYGFGAEEAKRAVAMIKADGLILHLNPLQEALQKDGETNFKGLLNKIKQLVKAVNFPIIVKEVGNGISYQTAKKLYNAGVKIIDIAGAGGTSWAEIEARCASGSRFEVRGSRFRNWGIKTVDSLIECKKINGLKVIASGGIRNGIEIAKAIVLGADLVGLGLPFLKPAQQNEKEVEKVLQKLIYELKLTMFCVGVKKIEELRKIQLLNC